MLNPVSWDGKKKCRATCRYLKTNSFFTKTSSRFPSLFRRHTSIRRRFVYCERAIAALSLLCDCRYQAARCQVRFRRNLDYFLSKCRTFRGAAWEDQFLDTVGYHEDNGSFKHISIARFASRTLDHELEKNTRTVIPYFSSTFILMAIFR